MTQTFWILLDLVWNVNRVVPELQFTWHFAVLSMADRRGGAEK
jgi:hypothetical protein